MAVLFNSDCLKALSSLEENSISSLVTDPPAGISFMGKAWDSDKGGRDCWIAWLTDVMRECHRVLKPGAHGLIWAIPRTSHWTMTALENAGFEIRDVVTHLFGTGFPKSMDVSKAIDKEAGAKREVVGRKSGRASYAVQDMRGGKLIGGANSGIDCSAITAPSTDSARQWQGFGTALKPACEFWVLIRKPCSEKTVAKNVLKWGTGALNIDASRILSDAKRPDICDACAETLENTSANTAAKKTKRVEAASSTNTADTNAVGLQSADASTIHSAGQIRTATYGSNSGTTVEANTGTSLNIDSSGKVPTAKCQLDTSFITKTKTSPTTALRTCVSSGMSITSSTTPPSTLSTKSAKPNTLAEPASVGRFPSNLVLDEEAAEALDEQSGLRPGDNPNRSPRNNGAFKSVAKGAETARLSLGHSDAGGASRFFYVAKASKSDRGEDNKHPTVKSTKLMSYLCRLVTPPGGVVLDPFMGSGSTGVAAKAEGFDFVGIEREADYFETSKKRIG